MGEPAPDGLEVERPLPAGEVALLAERRALRAEASAREEALELRARVGALEAELEAVRAAAAAAAADAERRVERLRRALSHAIVTVAEQRGELQEARERAATPEPAPATGPPDLAALGELARTLRAPATAPGTPKPLVADLDAAAAALRARTEAPAPASGDAPLRRALVRLAQDDPAAAAAVLVGLLPGQWPAVEEPIEYDLTITEAGTYAVSVTAGSAAAERIPRPRRRVAFHLRADALTLARLLAGDGPKPRRFGRAKVTGRRRRLKALEPLRQTTLGLEDVLRAGATLDPALALRCLAYSVEPAWTRGHRFTIAHTLTGPEQTLHLTAAGGSGLEVTARAPAAPPDATVSISRPAFDALLRGERPPDRPTVRGDHHAVDRLRAWAERVRRGELT